MVGNRFGDWAARLAFDAVIAFAAYLCACAVVVDQPLSWWLGSELGRGILSLGLLYSASIAGVFIAGKVERRQWRTVSAHDVGLVIRMTVVGALAFLILAFLTSRAAVLPRSVLVVSWFLTTGAMAAARLVVRARAEGWLLDIVAPFRSPSQMSAKPMVVLVGHSVRVQRALFDIRDTNAPYRPIGVILEDLPSKSAIIGARVMGSTHELVGIVETLTHRDRLNFSLVFVDSPTSMAGVDETVLAKLRRTEAPILRLPKVTELTEQDRKALQFRKVRLEELLSRQPVNLNSPEFVPGVRGKRVLVTGAGGSIGSEISRQLAALGCSHLTMLDIAETPLFEIDREIGSNYPSLSRRAALCDVRDEKAVAAGIEEQRPERIYHAAALKHVSLMETHPRDAILTNIAGTANVAKAAQSLGVGQMVLLSTDKAVNPSSVMGATKRLAETLVRGLNADGDTHFSVVRFGNVLNSNGSAVPIFRRQIEAGGPVTVTHPEVERYFMTIPEAVQLVLHAADVAEERGERDPGVFVLEMGAPVKIMDMARRMIDLLAPPAVAPNIEIKLIGLQPGEKLSEELVDSDEETIYSTEGVLEVRGRRAVNLSYADVDALCRFCTASKGEAVRNRLFDEVQRVRMPGAESPRLQVVRGDAAPRA